MYRLTSMPMTRGLEDPTNQAAEVALEEKDMCYGIMYQGEGVHSVLKARLTDPFGPTDWKQTENRSEKPKEEYVHSDWGLVNSARAEVGNGSSLIVSPVCKYIGKAIA